jgi:hypothetical protein
MFVGLHPILTSVLGRDEWSASCPIHFTRERIPKYTLNRRLGVLQNQSRILGKEKNLFPYQESNHISSVCSLGTVLTTLLLMMDSALPVLELMQHFMGFRKKVKIVFCGI